MQEFEFDPQEIENEQDAEFTEEFCDYVLRDANTTAEPPEVYLTQADGQEMMYNSIVKAKETIKEQISQQSEIEAETNTPTIFGLHKTLWYFVKHTWWLVAIDALYMFAILFVGKSAPFLLNPIYTNISGLVGTLFTTTFSYHFIIKSNSRIRSYIDFLKNLPPSFYALVVIVYMVQVIKSIINMPIISFAITIISLVYSVYVHFAYYIMATCNLSLKSAHQKVWDECRAHFWEMIWFSIKVALVVVAIIFILLIPSQFGKGVAYVLIFVIIMYVCFAVVFTYPYFVSKTLGNEKP